MFSCNNYDIIIIGGGISGLFIAYKLINTNLDILLIESSSNLGGRIYSENKNGVSFECGAARFHDSHTKVLTLIHDLNLEDKIVSLPNEIKHILRGYKTDYNYKTKDKLNLSKLLKEAYQKRETFETKFLQNMTFFQYLTNIFNHETATFIQHAFGYDSEFIYLNADAALKMFKDDFFKKGSYHILNGGLSQIIKKLEQNINQCNHITILKENTVKEVYKNYIITDKDTYYFTNLICAIPQKALQQFTYFKGNTSLNAVRPIPLLRIYAKYPTKDLWFKGLKRITTDNHIRHIIPLSEKDGLIMISYTDGEYAEMWNKAHSNGDDFLIQLLNKEIKDLLGLEPSKPEFISIHFWNEGVHMWRTGYNMDESYQKVLKPFEHQDIFICGEAYSKKQGWIEGALNTCYDVIQSLPLLDSRGLSIQTDIDKEDIFVDKDDIIKKEYTIQEVLKEPEWIIIEVEGNKNIYDLSEWIPKHPGGSVIYEGIEANRYYLEGKNKKYKKSPTDIFLSISAHNISNVYKKFFIMENNDVKLVGTLK